MAALLRPKQVAGAADLKVLHRNPEASTKLRRLLDGLEPLLGLRCHWLILPVEQVGVGALRAPPDTAAQLVELGQPIVGRLIDNERIGVWNIKPALDDGRADKYIIPAGKEI